MKNLLVVLCLALTFTAGAAVSNAQTAADKSARQILSEIVRAKGQSGSFTLITPGDLAKLPASDLNTLLQRGDPCDAAMPIGINESVNGQLTTADCLLEDGSYADFYMFNGQNGQNIVVTLNSAAFDTYLGLANSTGTFVLEDDNGGGGTNSRIQTVLPQTGTYIILANSLLANQFGNYTVGLHAFAACTYSINPTSATIAPEGGTFSFTVTTGFGCQWASSVSSGSQFLTITNGSGTGTGTLTYTATANGYNQTRTGQIIVGGRTFTVTQPPMNCTFSINPTSVTAPANGMTGTFTLTTQPGCVWLATYNGFFIWTNTDVHTGSAEILYTVSRNLGANTRTGTITVGGHTFTITQPGLNCSYSVSPMSISVDRGDNYGSVTITTQPECSWSVYNGSWITVDRLSGTGSGTVNYRIWANPYSAPRTGVIPFIGIDWIRVAVTQSATFSRTRFDFDGDGKADVSTFRPSTGAWYLNQSQAGFTGQAFGASGDKIVPADYDGDGKTDIAVFRAGVWYIQRSQLGFIARQFGAADDVPVPADYDLNGTTDIAVWRPSSGTWYIYNLFNNNLMFYPFQFGANTDVPVATDFDGDGRAETAVFRPSNGTWYIRQINDGSYTSIEFGTSDDKPVPADYDGDGKTDIAVFRPSNGAWYLQQSTAGFSGIAFGLGTDLPTPADYDGDGKADVAVFRSGTWYLNRSSAGFTGISFGVSSDVPVPNAFVH